MANGRGDQRRKKSSGRDAGGFVALPWSVLDSKAYLGLSHPAKALLLEVARQYRSDDNGRMLLSGKYLATRGWNSPEVIVRAKRELLNAGLIFETVMGQRPNKASWFAVTWYALDRIPGFDAGAWESFERSAYLRHEVVDGRRVSISTAPPSTKSGKAKQGDEIEGLTTPAVVESNRIATSPVVGKVSATTSDVAIGAVLTPPPTTSPVHPLEKPSAAVRKPRRAQPAALVAEAADDKGETR